MTISSKLRSLISVATGNESVDVRPKRTIIAFDLGATTGWAMWRDGVVTSGTQKLTKDQSKRFDSPGMKFIRFTRFLQSFPRADVVAFEEVRRHLGVDAAHAYGGYLSHLTAFCDAQTPPIPYEGVGVAKIKIRATGKGNATKEMMVDACQKLGTTPNDDNEADALWLLAIVSESEGLPWPWGVIAQPPGKTKTKKTKGRRRVTTTGGSDG